MRHFAFIILVIFFFITPCSALYDFEGVPLDLAATGETDGSLYCFGTYGLSDPPVECKFTLPGKPVWAKVYTGVWGGTEKYTGSAEISVNSLKIFRYSLYGEQDRNEDVYCSGYGVYWIGQEVTDLLHSGENSVTVDTSRGEEGSKIDGRVYGIFVVAAVDDGSGYITQYWVAEGNENLHGEGWSGNNPTIHNTASYTFEGADLTGDVSSELTTVLLASTRYQPDYISLNSKDLGTVLHDSNRYPDKATDIGDEISFNADGSTGRESRYIDAETFDVSELVIGENVVVFERGRDSNGDGVIDSSSQIAEGEDYIHPCIAALAIKKKKTEVMTDVGIRGISTSNIYDGSAGTITADLINYGGYSSSPVTVGFYADGVKIGTGSVTIGRSGIGTVSTDWTPEKGDYTLSAKIESPSDSGSSNDEYSMNYRVEDLPDISLKLSAPVKAGEETETAKQSPSLLILPVLAGAAAAVMYRKTCLKNLLAIGFIFMIVSSPLLIQPSFAAGQEYGEYILPVEVLNNGGGIDTGISLTVYLDGEKTAYTTLDGGMDSNSSETVNISIFTTPGRHTVRIIADEENSLDELNEDNNFIEASYDFP